MNIEIPPFYVGQEVVAIVTKKHYKKGQEYKVLEIGRTSCCGIWYVYIGTPTQPGFRSGTRCATCNKDDAHPTLTVFSAHNFAPKLHLSDFISMKQLVEETLEVTGAN